MAEIVNLNRARKARLKADKAAAALSNRATFGRLKAERIATEAERIRTRDHLDQHRLDRPQGEE